MEDTEPLVVDTFFVIRCQVLFLLLRFMLFNLASSAVHENVQYFCSICNVSGPTIATVHKHPLNVVIVRCKYNRCCETSPDRRMGS